MIFIIPTKLYTKSIPWNLLLNRSWSVILFPLPAIFSRKEFPQDDRNKFSESFHLSTWRWIGQTENKEDFIRKKTQQKERPVFLAKFESNMESSIAWDCMIVQLHFSFFEKLTRRNVPDVRLTSRSLLLVESQIGFRRIFWMSGLSVYSINSSLSIEILSMGLCSIRAD